MSELRDLLDGEARRIEGEDDALSSVMRRVRRRRRTRRAATATLALMIAATGAVGVYQGSRPGPEETELGQGAPNEVFEGIWPETGPKELKVVQRSIDEGHQPWRTDPVETARAFATNVMQWRYDRVQAEVLGRDDPSAVLVELHNLDRPSAGADVTTLVTLKQLGGKGEQGVWSVVSAEGGLLNVSATTGPGTRAEPGTHLLVVGDIAQGTEGTSVEVGVFAGEGGIPFDSEGSLAVRRIDVSEGPHFGGDLGPMPEDPDGSVVVIALARDPSGNITGAAAARIPVPTPETSTQVTVYFSPDQEDPAVIESVTRLVPQGIDPLEAALRALLQGPTAEEREGGLQSPFSERTAALLNFVTVEEGTATVDLSGSLPELFANLGAQAPAHAAIMFSAQLNATVFQFPEISQIRYQLDGSCQAFAEWLGYSTCTVVAPQGFYPEVQLPPVVAAKRDAILEAARERKYETLRRLGAPGNFTFSYGGGRDPVSFWQELESQGQDPLGILEELLSMPYIQIGDTAIFVWPSFFTSNPNHFTEAELRLVRKIATEEEIQSWRELGQYLGYRVGIEPDGDWLFFVAGD